jgi:hypothetical protein
LNAKTPGSILTKFNFRHLFSINNGAVLKLFQRAVAASLARSTTALIANFPAKYS